MSQGAAAATFPWSKGLAAELNEKEFRDAYVADHVRTNIAFQIRALREQPGRRWSQSDLAERSGTTQSVISRLENPDYGKLSLQTLLDMASTFDIALLVQFVEWPDWLARMSNVSPSALQKRSFDVGQLVKRDSDLTNGIAEIAMQSNQVLVGKTVGGSALEAASKRQPSSNESQFSAFAGVIKAQTINQSSQKTADQVLA